MTRPRFGRRVVRLAIIVGRSQSALHRRMTIGALFLACATALVATGLPRISLDNRTSSWIEEAGSVGAFDGSDSDFVLLVRRGVDAASVSFVATDRELAASLREIDGVAGVESVSRVLDRLNLARLEDLGDGSNFFDNSLLFDGRSIAAQRIWLEPGRRSTPIVEEIERVVHSRLEGVSVLGPAAFNAALDRRSRRESARVFSFALAAASAVLALSLRSIGLALALVATSLTGVVWFLGTAGWCGVSFNFLTINVPVLAFVIALALNIHPLCAWLRLKRRGLAHGPVSFRAVALRTFPGCFFAAATTTAGFASLTLAKVGAVREFGLLAALSIPTAFISGIVCLPLALIWQERGGRLPAAWPSRVPWLLDCIRRYRTPIRVSTPIVFLIACLLLPTLSIDHQALDFFAKNDPFREAYARSANELVGLAPLEVEVSLPGSVSEPANMRLLEQVVSTLEQAAGLSRSYSVLELVKLAASIERRGAPGSYSLPDTDPSLKLAYVMTSLAPDATAPFVSLDRRRCRVVLPLNVIGAAEFRRLCDEVSRRSEAFPGVRAEPGGRIYRLMRMQEKTLDEQIVTLGTAMAGISILLGLFLGSARLSLLTLIVNFLPLAVTGSAMALLDMPLDLTTAMVASVALGIAVDDTIHLLWEARRGPVRSSTHLEAVLERVSPPIAMTSFVLAIGFSALGTASFPPIARLGWLTAATLTLSLVVHLGVLPAFLDRGDPQPRERCQGIRPIETRETGRRTVG